MSSHQLILSTRRLRLIATTLQHIEAELRGPKSLADLLGVPVPPSWPPGEYDRNALEYFRDRLTDGGPSHNGWYGWYALADSGNGQHDWLVAAAGYMGPPSDGSVEIGYSTIPEARGRGYATEIVEALVAHAFNQSGVQVVIAHTSDDNAHSTQALLRCGFYRVAAPGGPGPVQYRKDHHRLKPE